MRWNHNDKGHSNKHKDSDSNPKGSKSNAKLSKKHEDQKTPLRKKNDEFEYQSSKDDTDFTTNSALFSRSTSRRSHTPTPSLRRTWSRSMSNGTKLGSFRRSLSVKTAATSSSPNLSFDDSIAVNGYSKLTSPNCVKSPTNAATLSKSTSRRSTTPIIYSQSTARRKPQPIEIKLECSLEELCLGAVKTIQITKDVISDGIIVKAKETLQVKIKAGSKKGTKIRFEGKGDEKPGYLPADIIYLIEEKRHPMFKWVENDNLELGIQIPLLKALVGCSLKVPLLGGENINLFFDHVIHPCYQKVIPNQGMPKEKEDGQRGDLLLKFLVDFPKELSDDQRSNICNILESSKTTQ